MVSKPLMNPEDLADVKQLSMVLATGFMVAVQRSCGDERSTERAFLAATVAVGRLLETCKGRVEHLPLADELLQLGRLWQRELLEQSPT